MLGGPCNPMLCSIRPVRHMVDEMMGQYAASAGRLGALYDNVDIYLFFAFFSSAL